jgi:hypothetical protein
MSETHTNAKTRLDTKSRATVKFQCKARKTSNLHIDDKRRVFKKKKRKQKTLLETHILPLEVFRHKL